MLQRFLGTILFLIPSLALFDCASRLASEQRDGWGWFLFAGLIVTGVALNFWNGEVQGIRSPTCKEPISQDRWDLE